MKNKYDNTSGNDVLAGEIKRLIDALAQYALEAWETPLYQFHLEYAQVKQDQAFLDSDISAYLDEDKRRAAIDSELTDSKMSAAEKEDIALRFSLFRALLYYTVKAHVAEHVDAAWRNVALANQYMGEFNGHLRAIHQMKERKTVAAKKAANARYAEDHALKAEVYEYLSKNCKKDSGVDETVAAIRRVVPISPGEARSWFRSWKKEFDKK